MLSHGESENVLPAATMKGRTISNEDQKSREDTSPSCLFVVLLLQTVAQPQTAQRVDCQNTLEPFVLGLVLWVGFRW